MTTELEQDVRTVEAALWNADDAREAFTRILARYKVARPASADPAERNLETNPGAGLR